MSEHHDHLIRDDDTFQFFVPVSTIAKSAVREGEDKKRRWIQGIASTKDRDLQGESIVQRGIDFGYFLRSGYINDDHKTGPEHKVGEPTDCRLTEDGLWIKGYLYEGKPRADHWWEHLTALQANESSRKAGFSIQGKVLRRRGNVIEKCWLQDVAITASPVNTSTWAEIAKSLCAMDWCAHPWVPECPGGHCHCDTDAQKALSVGSSSPLTPESLEGEDKDVVTLDRGLDILQSRGYSPRTAKAVVDCIFHQHGVA